MTGAYDASAFVLAVLVLASCLIVVMLVVEYYWDRRDR